MALLSRLRGSGQAAVAQDQALGTGAGRADGLCEELRRAPGDAEPLTPEGCAECLAAGTSWVHLRMCLTCGHVGCCDTGDLRHARRHAEQTGHAVMRSFEPGERWRWCYVHELLG